MVRSVARHHELVQCHADDPADIRRSDDALAVGDRVGNSTQLITRTDTTAELHLAQQYAAIVGSHPHGPVVGWLRIAPEAATIVHAQGIEQSEQRVHGVIDSLRIHPQRLPSLEGDRRYAGDHRRPAQGPRTRSTMQNHSGSESLGEIDHRLHFQVRTQLRQVGAMEGSRVQINQCIAVLQYLFEKTVGDPRSRSCLVDYPEKSG